MTCDRIAFKSARGGKLVTIAILWNEPIKSTELTNCVYISLVFLRFQQSFLIVIKSKRYNPGPERVQAGRKAGVPQQTH